MLTILGAGSCIPGRWVGSMLKVMTNYLATANLITLSEALVTCKATGLDLNTTYEAIRISSGNSFVHETESQVILNGSRDINFTMDLVIKDISLFRNSPTAPACRSNFTEDDRDLQGWRGVRAEGMVAKHHPGLEEATGLDIRAPAFRRNPR